VTQLTLCFHATHDAGVNQTVTYKSGNKVTPNMSLLKSLRTQDSQQQARMDRYRKKTLRAFIAKKKSWARSPTSRWVTVVCESQIQQNVAECDNYLVFFDGGFEVLLLRKDEDGKGYFCDSCTSTTTCSSCCFSSPIVKFRRLRTLSFLEHYSESGRHIGYEVVCSCPYYACFGIPCRHFCVLLQVSRSVTLSHYKVLIQLCRATGSGTSSRDAVLKDLSFTRPSHTMFSGPT